jgi:hypothetical protein
MTGGITSLAKLAQQHRLRCVLIGGHAVSAQGYVRATLDVDVAVPETERAEWKQALLALGYRVFHEQAAFLQLRAPLSGGWPVDLMVVENGTFDKLMAASDRLTFDDEPMHVASRRHLIAMKLHALKSRQEHRWTKDVIDLSELLALEKIAVTSDEFQRLCETFGGPGLYQELKNVMQAGKK